VFRPFSDVESLTFSALWRISQLKQPVAIALETSGGNLRAKWASGASGPVWRVSACSARFDLRVGEVTLTVNMRYAVLRVLCIHL